MKATRSTSRVSIVLLLFQLWSAASIAQGTGDFKGKIIEQTTKQTVIGASIVIDKSSYGSITDSSGIFSIRHLPAGTYAVTITIVGFQTRNISEIIISSGKTYYSEIELLPLVADLNEVKVSGRAFKGESNPMTPVSTFSYSREEIFRNPGSQGDIMRALSSLPGVVSSGAQFSAIAARGQGTQDNVYMVDDIPMFNLSHLEAEGFVSGFNDPNGGRFSIFAPRVIDNVQFQNGGFDATYGRKSSSYLALGIKEGNKETWSFTGQFDLLGGTLIFDGPVSRKTSVFASARYQNFSALTRMLDLQNAGATTFGDYMIKTTTQLNAKNKLSFVAMVNPERPYRRMDGIVGGTNVHDDNSVGTLLFDHRGNKAVAGLNLRTLIDARSYWKNVLYFRSSTVDNDFGNFTPSLDPEGVIIDPGAGRYDESLRSIKNDQQEIGYRSIYTRRFNRVTMVAGIDAMIVNLDYERTLSRIDTVYSFRTKDYRPDPNQYYQVLNPSLFNAQFEDRAFNGSGYVNLSWRINDWLTLNPGLRYDYTGFAEQHTISPRISGSIALNNKHSINFSSGIYYQDAGYSDIAGQVAGNKLQNERSIQSILGYKIQFSTDLKFVAEGWYKDFSHLTVQPNRLQSFLTNNGSGHAYGADISLTKRLSRKYYGQVSYSYMVSKRNDNDGLGEYDYFFSIPHTISLMASYKPDNRWIFSGKFRYSTGRPADDFVVHSNVLNNADRLRYSQEIVAVNGKRFPDFYSLDLRVDYNIQMKRGTFSAFLDLVNVSNRFNINNEIFLPQTGRIFNMGLGIFPTFGVRVEL